MKKLVVALSALAAFTGSALAADMAPRAYTKASPPPPVAVVNWTGCYVGGGGGYGMWNQENTLFDDRGGGHIPVTAAETSGGRGYFGTVQGGCDYQFALGTYNLVFGAFGDYDFASEKGQLNIQTTGAVGQEKLSQKWAVGGRIGVLVTPSLLTYVSGGYTEAKFDRVDFSFFPNPASVFFMNSRTYGGYFIGTGDEYALSFLPGLFWKTEYRFSQFDTKTTDSLPPPPAHQSLPPLIRGSGTKAFAASWSIASTGAARSSPSTDLLLT